MTAALEMRAARDVAEDQQRRFRQSGLPRAYATGERSLESLPPCAYEAVGVCLMLGHQIDGLYVYGTAGSFKTSVAAAALAERIRAGKSGRYVFIPDLFSDLYAIYAADDQRSRADLVDAMVQTPLLVLDDLGKEKASEHAASVIFEILDGRYRNRAPGRWTIVTSNLPMTALCSRFAEDTGEPIERRLAEMTVAVRMTRGAA